MMVGNLVCQFAGFPTVVWLPRMLPYALGVYTLRVAPDNDGNELPGAKTGF